MHIKIDDLTGPEIYALLQEHLHSMTLHSPPESIHALDLDASGERLAFGSTTGSVWISENQGDDWLTLAEHLPPVHAVVFV